MIKKCGDAGVPTAVYYPIPLHLQNVFKYLGYKEGDFPVTETVSKDIMALPMSAFLKEEEQKFVIDTVNS
jgi:UDP-2-acetamido-2-deoxy-ribo-hexuluronate aminotransferase